MLTRRLFLGLVVLVALACTTGAQAVVTPAGTADMVNLGNSSKTGIISSFQRLMPNGTFVDFSIPAGKKLVIKAIYISFVNSGPASLQTQPFVVNTPFWAGMPFRPMYSAINTTYTGTYYFNTNFADGIVVSANSLLNAKVVKELGGAVVPGRLSTYP